MKLYDLEEMKKHPLHEGYDYENHKWINQKLSCSCIAAVCTDVELSKEEKDYLSARLTKISNLKTFIKETEEYNPKYMNELEETQLEMYQFVDKQKEKYGFSDQVDLNFQYYFVKIKQGKECKN
jgi:hypothetical protein